MSAPPHHVLAVTAPADRVLHHIAPLGLAGSAGSALVVDLDGASASYPGISLADLVDGGLRRAHLAPERRGVAVIANGGVGVEEAAPVLDALLDGWPRVVLRVGHGGSPLGPVVPVIPLLPDPLRPSTDGRVVVQRTSRLQRVDGVSLPPLRRSRIESLMSGKLDPRWAWVRAWRRVWELPWG